ncbi:unnamed protein product [Phytophthora fragariaefolia]|uniref:Unnamed protein product n=1 Tax=Phytophthora fragariaefolia TaxID=1490495 RepID=A0A9W6YJK0_9STRA|nr:unnamed protein product [Phytophthora fragariaefolia]
MDGYRQTLLGRALADALRELELELEQQQQQAPPLDGDLLFSLFDEAVQTQLRQDAPFTHEALELAGQLTAFNRFLADWSVQARVRPQDVRLNHCVADLHVPPQQQQQQQQQQDGQQGVAVRLKLRQRM